MVRACQEKGRAICGTKGAGNGVSRKETQRKSEKKMYGSGERGHEGERSGGGKVRGQGSLENNDVLLQPRIGKS